MNETQIELFLKELSARLPYGLMVEEIQYISPVRLLYVDTFRLQYRTYVDENEHDIFKRADNGDTISLIKPYLRPLSSMTDKEKSGFLKYFGLESVSDGVAIFKADEPIDKIHLDFQYIADMVDWLNKHHFDYLGLIEKGLALEAPADMYTF